MDYRKIFISFMLMYLTACNLSLPANTESLGYELSVNGCTTGKKTFSDLDSYCRTLQDNAANNYCAQTNRESLFNQKCSGTFNPFKLKIDIY